MLNRFEHSFHKLQQYVEKENYKGWDPFDGLNSILFQSLPFIKNIPLFRLIWIQLFKRNPINFRTITGVPKEHNPKALGLFLSGYCRLYNHNPNPYYLEKIQFLADTLLHLQNKNFSGACWGYNFDWQARAFFQPKNTPTVVATSFIVEALLNAYKITNNQIYLTTALSAKDFILKDLNRTYDTNGNFCFSYSPQDQTQVFNAGLLGAKTLSLIYEHTKELHSIDEAKKVVQYVVNHQNSDGSWTYGTLPFHQWVDNFHTGYNLEAISIYQRISGDASFASTIEKGLAYYLNNFFTASGISKYYNTKIYPVDIHAPAQLIVTLDKLGILSQHQELVQKVLQWTIENMQDSKGYFYYQKKKYLTIKIPYMRWANAWMFYALSHYLTGLSQTGMVLKNNSSNMNR